MTSRRRTLWRYFTVAALVVGGCSPGGEKHSTATATTVRAAHARQAPTTIESTVPDSTQRLKGVPTTAADESDRLPTIVASDAASGRDAFDSLYFALDAPYGRALRRRGVTVIGLSTQSLSGTPKIVIQIPPGAAAKAARAVLLSVFAHPELVSIEEAVIIRQ